MAATAVRRLAYASLPVLYLLHNDLWFWYDRNWLLGLPIGLTYHVLFVASVVLAMWWLVRSAWPAAELDRLATGPGSPQPANVGEGEARPPEDKG